MLKDLSLAGSIIGLIGVLICAGSGLARILGMYYIVGFQSTTLFTVGVGLMVFSCMVKLDVLLDRN